MTSGQPGTTPDASVRDRPVRRVLSLRDFRLLLGGTATSLLGDQFALIATPWLALALTDDPLALGVVLALEGVPRAVFMLVGGAITDRVAPRRVMLTADLARGVLVAAMAGAVLTGVVQMWMLYGFALGFGLIAGFAVPAENSIVPTLLRRDDLQTGNAVMMGVAQLTGFVGPTLAGAAIAGSSSATSGVGLAYAIDAATFAVSATAFVLMRPAPVASTDDGGLIDSIRTGVRHIWDDEALRFVVGVLAAVNFLVVGPLMVGIPLLAHQRLAASAAAFGVLMGAFAVGNLAGLVVAGTTRSPSSATMRTIVIGVLAGYGVVVSSLSIVAQLVVDAALLAALGAGNGYLAITLFTWVQARTPQQLLGRIVSVVTFASLGLVSVSQAVSGALAKWDLNALFALSGGLVVATTCWASNRPGMRAFTSSLADLGLTGSAPAHPIPSTLTPSTHTPEQEPRS